MNTTTATTTSALKTSLNRLGLGALAAVVAAVVAVSPATAAPAPAAVATVAPMAAKAAALAPAVQLTSFDAQMVTLVNNARSAAGLAKLTPVKGLTHVAFWWSAQMYYGKTGYNLQHNPYAWDQVAVNGAANRTTWGENVGWSSSTTTTAAQLFSAYMHSPGHKANIMSPAYHFIGMGSTQGSHGLYNTTEFTDKAQTTTTS